MKMVKSAASLTRGHFLRKRANDFLHWNNIHAEKQFGFRKKFSTQKALISLSNEICCSLNNRMHMGGVSCGLAKASDCVNHELLLMKLKCYGIQCIARQWFYILPK